MLTLHGRADLNFEGRCGLDLSCACCRHVVTLLLGRGWRAAGTRLKTTQNVIIILFVSGEERSEGEFSVFTYTFAAR